MKRAIGIFVFLLATALAAGCGGGGGGGGQQNQQPPQGGGNWDQMVWDQDNWG